MIQHEDTGNCVKTAVRRPPRMRGWGRCHSLSCVRENSWNNSFEPSYHVGKLRRLLWKAYRRYYALHKRLLGERYAFIEIIVELQIYLAHKIFYKVWEDRPKFIDPRIFVETNGFPGLEKCSFDFAIKVNSFYHTGTLGINYMCAKEKGRERERDRRRK